MAKYLVDEVEHMETQKELEYLREKVKKQKAILDKYADLGIDVFHED